MEMRIIFGLGAIAAIIEGLAPGVVPQNLLPLILVILGLVYGFMCLDAEDSVMYVAVTIGLATAAGMDVLDSIHIVGAHLDNIVDQLVKLYLGGVLAIVATRIFTRIKG